MQKLSDIGEQEAISRLTAMLGVHPALKVGTGDDCAVCSLADSGYDQVFTTDPVIEQVHFDSGESPERIGNKAAGRALSDIAAMGARPQWMLINIVAPEEQPVEVLERIYQGITSVCHRFGATVIGGDLAKGPCLELHVFCSGLLPVGKALLRSGAQCGDAVLVSGPLGCSITGKHLDFVPRVEEGVFLRESGMVNSMMDISDGLATDLRHILKQSGVGALLDAKLIPKVGTLEQALYDGEDFELLLTVEADHVGTLAERYKAECGTELIKIGEITNETGVLMLQQGSDRMELKGKAFEHFSTKTTGGRDE